MRLQKEAIAAGKLKHENILEVYDFGLAEGNTPYLVMAYLDGVSLLELLKIKGRLKPEDAVYLFIQLARGMKHAHANGVLHRDLKPGNVMISDLDNDRTIVKILDFGLARLKTIEEKSLTQSGEGIGSPYYMSPEQAAGDEIDDRADIYSMGCLMYEVLSGKPPFVGETALETTLMHKTESPISMNELGDSSEQPVLEELDELVLSCLSKHRDDRPQSFTDIENQLVAILDQFSEDDKEASTYRVDSKGEPVPKGVKVAFLALIILLFVGIALSIFYQGSPVDKKVKQKREFNLALLMDAPAIIKKRDGKHESQLVIECEEPVTDKGLRIIAKDKEVVAEKIIRKLIFINGVFTGSGFDAFKNVEIKELHLKNCDITDEGIKEVAKLEGLNILTLNECPKLTDRFTKNLVATKSLWVLQTDCPQLTEETLGPLKEIDSMHSVYPHSMKLTSKGVKCILALKKLSDLGFSKNQLEVDGFAALKSIKKPTSISFVQYKFENNELVKLIGPVKSSKVGFAVCEFSSRVKNGSFKFSEHTQEILFSNCTFNFPVNFNLIKKLNPQAKVSVLRDVKKNKKSGGSVPEEIINVEKKRLKDYLEGGRDPGYF